MAKAHELRLQYFAFPGRAERIRLAFALGGVSFVDDRFKPDQWQEVKPTTPYGQVPVLYIDGKPMAQSLAILRYAGRLAPALYPADKQNEIDCAIELVADFEARWAPAIYLALRPEIYGFDKGYNKTPEGAAQIKRTRERFLAEELPVYAKWLGDKIAESGGQFLCGADITIADCYLAPELKKFQAGYIDHVPITSLDAHPALADYVKRFYEHPRVKAYYDAQASL